MKRRSFIQHGCRGLAAAPFYSALAALGREVRAQAISPAVLRRIGITTVCFRDRFASTRSAGAPPLGSEALTLLAAPKFIADQLGLHNVEVWNEHFDDLSLDYCRRFKATAAAAGSTITNIQLDGPYDLSAADPAARDQSIVLVKQWMDRAAAVGAPRLRANTGGQRGDPVSDQTVDSFRQLAAYGKTIGVRILVENHIGMSMDIPKVVEIVRRVNDPNCRALSDWGNTPSGSTEARVASLREMLPLIDLVSAKEVDFDRANRHVSYDVVPIIDATEASGFRGIYSIELYGQSPPPDPVAAAKSLMQTIAAHIRA